MGQEFWLGSGYVLSVGIPISKDKTVTLGTSYHYMGYAKEGVRYNINQFTFDLMGIGKGWNGIYRIGIPFSCTASYEGSKTSVQDIVNPINISIGGGYGWSVGNLCLGVNIEIRMSNLFKKKQIDNKGSMGFNMGTVLSYRF
jgi:hypothetical protein